MRARLIFAAATIAMLIAPASASALFAHVVAPGETLTSIAATDGPLPFWVFGLFS